MKIGSWPERISRLVILEELAVAYYRHRKRETRWWQDVWMWCCYQIISGYPAGELDHWGPLFRAAEARGPVGQNDQGNEGGEPAQ